MAYNKQECEKIIAKHVAARLAKAKELGSKASWRTEDHLDALAEMLAIPEADVREILGAHYNISGFQQQLAKTFAGSGHFQRDGKRSISADDYLAQLAKEVNG